MVKLHQSSRPKRRKKSETFFHDLQRDVFGPTLASSMSDVGIVARILVGLYVPLIIGYLTTSNALPDYSDIKATYYRDALYLTGVAAFFAAIEVLRTIRMLDTERFGNFPKFALVAIVFLSFTCLFAGIGNLVQLHIQGHQQRLLEQQRRAQEREAKEAEDRNQEKRRKEVDAECNAAKVKEVEVLTRRRAGAYGEHRKCLAEWIKPSPFSSETAEQACAQKYKDWQLAAQTVKNREGRECASASK